VVVCGIVLGIGVAGVLLAAMWPSIGRPAVAQPGQADRGLELYRQNCASCHGPGGAGTEQGPSLIGVGAATVDFMLSTGRMPLGDPGQQPVRLPPAFPPEDIEALVAYVTSLGEGGPAIPEVDPEAGDLSLGREVFTDNCAACHGSAGQGASVGGGRIAPPLHEATDLQIAEAVRAGPGAMPPFGEDGLDQEQLDAVVRYVLSLREPEDRGGLGLGHAGPVIEGFIAWFLGLGVLIVVIRRSGTRT
jgi:ubiquinol-cytochrome c reductase cytochrome c subunit